MIRLEGAERKVAFSEAMGQNEEVENLAQRRKVTIDSLSNVHKFFPGAWFVKGLWQRDWTRSPTDRHDSEWIRCGIILFWIATLLTVHNEDDNVWLHRRVHLWYSWRCYFMTKLLNAHILKMITRSTWGEKQGCLGTWVRSAELREVPSCVELCKLCDLCSYLHWYWSSNREWLLWLCTVFLFVFALLAIWRYLVWHDDRVWYKSMIQEYAKMQKMKRPNFYLYYKSQFFNV